MHQCIICKRMKYYLWMVKVSVNSEPYQEKHMEICYKCLNNIGFKTPHEGD